MVKSQIKLVVVFLLSSFLISFNANAHHKENSKYLEISWDKENVSKKDAEKDARQTYCSVNAKAKTIKKKSVNLETGEIIEETQNIIAIKGYHDTKPRQIKKGFLPLRSKKLDLNIYEDTTLLEVLKLYCVQLKSEVRPDLAEFKTTDLTAFYKVIAAENRFFNSKDEPDYNLPIVGGSLIDDILDKGISIKDKNAVFYYPDYLSETVKKNEKEAGDRAANKDWINKNKPDFIEKLKEKKRKFDKNS
jgi:hypothetical protein